MPEGIRLTCHVRAHVTSHVRSRDSTGSLRPPSQRPEFGNPWGARHPIGRGARHPHHTPTHAYSRPAPAAAQRPRPCHLSGDSARDVIMPRRLPGRSISTIGRGLRGALGARPAGGPPDGDGGRGRGHNMPSGAATCALPPQRRPATDGRGSPPLTPPPLSCSGTVVASNSFSVLLSL